MSDIEQIHECKTCGAEKPISAFYIRKETGRPRKECKACWALRTKAWAAANPDKRKGILRASEQRHKTKNAARRSAWKKANREKLNEQQRQWRQENPERNKAYGRKQYAKNPELARRRTRDWYSRNRDKALAWASDYAKRHDVRMRLNAARRERRKSDPSFAINSRMRVRLRAELHRKDPKAGRPWSGLVGYTVAQLRDHLESQFLKGMSWSNMRMWEIDHIVPLAAFNIRRAGDSEFMAAWSLANLRPLWRTDNRSKSAKRVFLL